ncbi:MAG: hypothetical protein WA208_21120, partial [Thermoanaerobaculia bacterium]
PGRSPEVAVLPVDLRGLQSPSFEADDVVVTTIRPAYRDALVFRARYLSAHRHFDEAAREYRATMELVPGDASIERELQMLEYARTR